MSIPATTPAVVKTFPTLASWCGLPLPKLPLDGYDSSTVFLYNQPGATKPLLYFTPTAGEYTIHCVRVGSWKLRIAQGDGQIYINDRPGSKTNYLLAKPAFYNLDLDPLESYDVAKAYPEIVARLQGEIKALLPTLPKEVQASYEELNQRVASVVTPPGAVPRILTGPNRFGRGNQTMAVSS